MEENKYRFCKKCLLRDLNDKNEYFKNLKDYIDNLDIEIKISEMVYEERLSICMECNMFQDGMCRICGCYVELRASIKNNYCPNKKW